MVTVLPPAVRTMLALLAPVLVGLKNTGISQPPATGAVHFWSAGSGESAKCVALAPVIEALTVASTWPSLLIVMLKAGEGVPTAWSPKAALLSTTLQTGRLEPLRSTVLVGAGVSSVTVSVAAEDALAFGVKFTVMVQNALTSSRAGATGQSFVCAKSAALVPLTAMLLMVIAWLPVLAYLTVLAAGAGVVATLPKSTSPVLTAADLPGWTLPETMKRSVSTQSAGLAVVPAGHWLAARAPAPAPGPPAGAALCSVGRRPR